MQSHYCSVPLPVAPNTVLKNIKGELVIYVKEICFIFSVESVRMYTSHTARGSCNHRVTGTSLGAHAAVAHTCCSACRKLNHQSSLLPGYSPPLVTPSSLIFRLRKWRAYLIHNMNRTHCLVAKSRRWGNMEVRGLLGCTILFPLMKSKTMRAGAQRGDGPSAGWKSPGMDDRLKRVSNHEIPVLTPQLLKGKK